MEPVQFHMAGLPRPQLRPRATARNGFATVYKDGKSRNYEASVRAVATKVMGNRPPFEGPLSVSLRFRMPIPKSASKRVKLAMAEGEIAPTSKPDLSNMVKALEDGMNKVVYRDDSQIVRNFNTKVYAENPGVDVRIEAYGVQELTPPPVTPCRAPDEISPLSASPASTNREAGGSVPGDLR